MQAYQISQTAFAVSWCLSAACDGSHGERGAGSKRDAVPHSPGRARRCYPSSYGRRCRRR